MNTMREIVQKSLHTLFYELANIGNAMWGYKQRIANLVDDVTIFDVFDSFLLNFFKRTKRLKSLKKNIKVKNTFKS
jgi:hypothetical protein